LAYLAVESDRPHRRETLAGLFWPDQPERAARHNLSQALFNLRHSIKDRDEVPPFLTITRQTLQTNSASDYWLDASAFLALQPDCHVHDRCPSHVEGPRPDLCSPCITRLEQAMTLHRGDLLEGFSLDGCSAFEEWILVQQERFRRFAIASLDRLSAHYEDCGEFQKAIGYARQWAQLAPLQERAHRQLMRLFMLNGRRDAALAQYETYHRVLARELGAEPEAETTAMYERIRHDRIRRGGDEQTGGQGDVPPEHRNLPVCLTPFIGREVELAKLGDCLRDPACRLLTVLGPGGIGKTRLALEAATQSDYAVDDICFVPLTPLRSPDAIVPTIVQALGLSFWQESRSRQQLLDHLCQKRLLLILDGFEHLFQGAELVTDILATAPRAKILVTSRARLSVPGEHLFSVSGLDFPQSTSLAATALSEDVIQCSSVQLFLTSARRIKADYTPTGDDLKHVAQICYLTQGMPLGILLAAAWMGTLSPSEIADEIAKGFDFLEADWGGAFGQHHSLLAVFDRSWDLLSAEQQQVFAGLSVFCGGFGREAAEQVTGISLRQLKSLVDRSILDHRPSGRYEVHELLRQYAAEKLGQSLDGGQAIADRHCAYYASALQHWTADLKGSRHRSALIEISAELANVRAAWRWAIEQGQVSRLQHMVEGLCLFYDLRLRCQEGEAFCRSAVDDLSRPGLRPSDDLLRVQIVALAWESRFAGLLGHTERARQLLRQGEALLASPELATCDVRSERAFVLLQTGHVTALGGDMEGARQSFTESLRLYQGLGDRWHVASVLNSLGQVAGWAGMYDRAGSLLQESLSISRELDDPRGVAVSVNLLGLVHAYQGRFEQSLRLARTSVEMYRSIGDRISMVTGLVGLCVPLLWSGEFDEVEFVLEQGLAICRESGSRYYCVLLTLLLALAKLHLGEYDQAGIGVLNALKLARRAGFRREIALALFALGCAKSTDRAGAEALRILERSASIYEQIGQREELGWALSMCGCVALGLGQLADGKRFLCDSLKIAAGVHTSISPLWALPPVSLFLVRENRIEDAVEIWALASRYAFVGDSRWWEDIVGKRVSRAAASLPSDKVNVAQARGRNRDIEATLTELLVELEGQGR
jgi:predicted ATPase/DNA-binding SARP family transcriptional activator